MSILMSSFMTVILVGGGAWAKTAPRREPKVASRYSAFASGVYAYEQQGARELQTSADSIYQVSAFKGSSSFLATGVDYSLNPNWALRGALVLREVYMEGEATIEGTSTRNKFALEQKFIGLQTGLRFRPQDKSHWSFLANIEASKGTSVKLKVLEGAPIDDSAIDLPFYGIISGGILSSWQLGQKSSHFWFEPGLSLGAIVTADPFIILAEGALSLRYQF